MMGRNIVKETNLSEYLVDNKSGNKQFLLPLTRDMSSPMISLFGRNMKEMSIFGICQLI